MRKATIDIKTSAARLTASELATAYRDGALTPTEALEACLALIDDVDDEIRAWQEVYTEDARAAAKAATEELSRAIEAGTAGSLPALFGVPVGLKDVIHFAGKVTTAGSTARLGAVASSSARIVENLLRNGAVIVG